MNLEFTWVDALMITFIFITLGLISGKNAHDKKMAKKEQESSDE